jgi:hypothetical protein
LEKLKSKEGDRRLITYLSYLLLINLVKTHHWHYKIDTDSALRRTSVSEIKSEIYEEAKDKFYDFKLFVYLDKAKEKPTLSEV